MYIAINFLGEISQLHLAYFWLFLGNGATPNLDLGIVNGSGGGGTSCSCCCCCCSLEKFEVPYFFNFLVFLEQPGIGLKEAGGFFFLVDNFSSLVMKFI